MQAVFIGQGCFPDLSCFPSKNGQKRPFFTFQPISLDNTRETSKNVGKSTLWTFPDHTRPKDKRKNRLLYMIAEKGIILL
jgi:hypothetical protein